MSSTTTKAHGKGSEFLAGLGMGYNVGIRPCWSKRLSVLTKEMMRRSEASKHYEMGSCIGALSGFVTVLTAIPAAAIGGMASIEGVTYLVEHMLRK